MADPQRDQAQAAVAHVARIAAEVENELPGARKGTAAPGPIDDRVEQLITNLKAGKVKSCGHLKNPQPVFAGLAFPDLIFCAKCSGTTLSKLMADPKRADVCDGCGKSDVIRFFEVHINAGSVLISGNVCSDCRASAS